MKNNNGFAHILLLIVGALAVVVVIMVAMMALQNNNVGELSNYVSQMQVSPSPSPISDDTSVETIEKELDATVVGDFEVDVDSMKEEASGL